MPVSNHPLGLCQVCGKRCSPKQTACPGNCRHEVSRRNAAAYRERQRGGPRRCVVCGEAIAAKTATSTCSETCWRAHRLGVQPEELPEYIPLAKSAVCDVCDKEFAPWRPRQRGCSEVCMRIGRLRRKLAKERLAPYPPRPCAVCGQEFVPDRKVGKVCPSEDCKAQHKRNLANARTRGGGQPGSCPIFCAVCGQETLAPHGRTVTCSQRECILERRRQTSRAKNGTEPCHCIVCGSNFWPPHHGQHYCCSRRCSVIAKKRKNQRTYENHRERILAENAQRLREDPEYADRRREVDRASRLRAAERKLAAQLGELHRRMADGEHREAN